MLGRRSFLSLLGFAPVAAVAPPVNGGGMHGMEAVLGESIKTMPGMLKSFELKLNAGDVRTIISDLMTKIEVQYVAAIEEDRDRPFRFQTWEGNYKDWGV